MKIIKKGKIGFDLLTARTLGVRRPLIVGWSLTKRCNLHCRYCEVWKKQHPELETGQILGLIKQMIESGTRRISFTGGEPLLREDIGEIISFCVQHGVSTAMNSNGILLPHKIKELAGLDILKLSLDGPQAIHDSLRGEGSYAQVLEAVRIAKSHGIKVSFLSVVSTENCGQLEAIVSLAKNLGITVSFQPATPNLLGGSEVNEVSPQHTAFHEAVNRLIELKRHHEPVANSLPVLRHFLTWPEGRVVVCAGGKVSCRVEPDGRVYHCGRVLVKGQANDAIQHGFKSAFESLQPMSCKQCWCAPRLEMNFIYRLHPQALLNIVNSV